MIANDNPVLPTWLPQVLGDLGQFWLCVGKGIVKIQCPVWLWLVHQRPADLGFSSLAKNCLDKDGRDSMGLGIKTRRTGIAQTEICLPRGLPSHPVPKKS